MEGKFFMQFIQAKRRDNKLNVRDNRPYAIDRVEFIKDGIGLYLTGFDGEKFYLTYSDLDWFRSDFVIVNSLKELERYKEVL